MLTGARLSAQRAYEFGTDSGGAGEPVELVPTALRVAGDIAARGRCPCCDPAALRVGAPTGPELAFETALAAIATSGAEAAEGSRRSARRTPAFPALGKEGA